MFVILGNLFFLSLPAASKLCEQRRYFAPHSRHMKAANCHFGVIFWQQGSAEFGCAEESFWFSFLVVLRMNWKIIRLIVQQKKTRSPVFLLGLTQNLLCPRAKLRKPFWCALFGFGTSAKRMRALRAWPMSHPTRPKIRILFSTILQPSGMGRKEGAKTNGVRSQNLRRVILVFFVVFFGISVQYFFQIFSVQELTPHWRISEQDCLGTAK